MKIKIEWTIMLWAFLGGLIGSIAGLVLLGVLTYFEIM
jgi:hypothetical protein